MNFIIREAVASDIEELLRLRQERMEVYLKAEKRLQTDENAWREAVLTWLAHPQAQVKVADRDGQLIGYMVAWLWGNPPTVTPAQVGLVSEMSVDGHCKQGGVGTALFAAMRDWFKGQGLSAIEVRVPHQQPIEQAFWRAMGASTYLDHFYYRLD
jgi:GNAT superfamily N-acetyltransferase